MLHRSSGWAWTFAMLFAASWVAWGGQDQDGQTLVVVNGKAIPRERLERMVAPLRGKLPAEVFARFEREAVGRIVQDELIEQFLQKEKYTPSVAELDAEIARYRRAYESSRREGEPSFDEALKQRGTSVEVLRQSPPAAMKFVCYIRRLMKEEDLRKTFQEHIHDFDGTEVRARHILLDTRAVKNPLTKEAMRSKAEEIRKRVLAGEDFAELAKTYSDCPSGEQGGDLGYFGRHGMMVEPFAAAAFALEKGGVSPVVETQFGFHIIQVTDIKPGKALKFEDVREKVEETWTDSRSREVFEEVFKAAKIEWPQGG